MGLDIVTQVVYSFNLLKEAVFGLNFFINPNHIDYPLDTFNKHL